MGLKRTPRYFLLAVGYTAIVNLAFLAALLLRFEGDVPRRFWLGYLTTASSSPAITSRACSTACGATRAP